MTSVADAIDLGMVSFDEGFQPSPEDAAWAARVLNDTPAPTPANGVPRTLVETIDDEARSYWSWGTPTGDFLARQMERLAQLVRWTGATTPADHEARMEVWEEDIRAQQYDRGYADGLAAGPACGREVA